MPRETKIAIVQFIRIGGCKLALSPACVDGLLSTPKSNECALILSNGETHYVEGTWDEIFDKLWTVK